MRLEGAIIGILDDDPSVIHIQPIPEGEELENPSDLNDPRRTEFRVFHLKCDSLAEVASWFAKLVQSINHGNNPMIEQLLNKNGLKWLELVPSGPHRWLANDPSWTENSAHFRSGAPGGRQNGPKCSLMRGSTESCSILGILSIYGNN